MLQISLTVNGATHQEEIAPSLVLADFLRDTLNLTGTHLGCEHGVCGSCTVLVDNLAVRSCLLLAAQVDGATVMTVEGLAPADGLHPLQRAFSEHHALQCGFCTPGLLMTAHALLQEEAALTRERVREAISGNLCRCTGYSGIVEAILEQST